MRITVNDTEVVIPSSLDEFTLGQRIRFHNEYGKDLDEMLKSITSMPDGAEKDLEIVHFQFEKLFYTVAFFANTTVDALKESEFIDDIASIYYSSLRSLFDEEQKVEMQTRFVWKGEEWELHEPELKNGSRMKFGEFIDSKQILKDLIELGSGKWEAMLRLCTIYLRKKGEDYKEAFLFEGSPRMKEMEQLPMRIALCVGFFLSSSMNISVNISKSSNPAELNNRVDSARNISSAGVG